MVWCKKSLADHFRKNLRRAVRLSVVTMALCHIVEGSISFCLIPVPMKLLPFFAQQSGKRIAFWQGHPNAKVFLRSGPVGLDEVVWVANSHENALA